MTQDLMLRRKWTFRAHGRQMIFTKKTFESDIHIIGRQDPVVRHTFPAAYYERINRVQKSIF